MSHRFETAKDILQPYISGKEVITLKVLFHVLDLIQEPERKALHDFQETYSMFRENIDYGLRHLKCLQQYKDSQIRRLEAGIDIKDNSGIPLKILKEQVAFTRIIARLEIQVPEKINA